MAMQSYREKLMLSLAIYQNLHDSKYVENTETSDPMLVFPKYIYFFGPLAITRADLLPLGVATLPNSLSSTGGGVPNEFDSSESIGCPFVGVSGIFGSEIVVGSSLIRTRVACDEGGSGLALENPITNQNPTNPVCAKG